METNNDLPQYVKDFSDGLITFREFQQRAYHAAQEHWKDSLLDLRNKGKWKEFIDFALSKHQIMPIAFQYFDEVPDELKYNFCIDAYTHHGDSVPAVRKAVRTALRYGKPNLPEELKGLDFIEVYRAGEEPPHLCPYRISWTADKNVALFFLNHYAKRHAAYLYKAKIKPQHVIAYTNERDEKEIMQYRHVYDVEVLEIKED